MNVLTRFRQSGAKREANVAVDISYDIIRHVSAQLYTTPRKAIEELICNSYDAGASECHVALPQGSADPLLVLDNGKSMDLKGIRELWHVAHSPKVGKDEDDLRIANGRMQIGKFGVGKLAAFALGKRLTHIACVNSVVRVISVGEKEIKGKKGGRAPIFKVFKMSLTGAEDVLTPLLGTLPKPWDKGWTTWTLAVVEDIAPEDVSQALKLGLLRRMIRTALPVSGRFNVVLQGDPVPRRTIDPDNVEVRVDVLDPKFRGQVQDALRDYWAALLNEKPEDVASERYKLSVGQSPDPEDATKQVRALIVPSLGPVMGSAISAKTSLTTEKLEERGYSDNGFAVTAYGKLVNPEDPLFGITQRSHKYWRKFLAQVEIPGLDKVLLVQRNAVSEKSPEAQIAREVLRTLFNYTRTLVEEKEEETGGYEPGSFGRRLASSSPILAQAALKGLLQGAITSDDLASLKIEFATFGPSGPPTRFDAASRTILVNQDHPLIAALDDLEALSQQMRRVIGEVLAGIEIGKGYLKGRGVDQLIIDETAEVIDASLRGAADYVRDPVEEHIAEIREASFTGGAPFEQAVVNAFKSLRLAARHLGKADEPDGIIVIPRTGMENLRISVEAKGSKGTITHKDLSEATVTRHSGDHACENAIAIARDFATDGIAGRDSALLRETKGKVPLLTLDGIERMLRLHKRRKFTYDKVAKILTTWNHPDGLLAFIEKTWGEMPDLGLMRLILTVAHDLVAADATNKPDPGMIVGDPRVRERRIKRDDVVKVLEAVQLSTGMITILNQNDYQFELNAPVDTILEAMQASYQTAPPAAADSSQLK